MFKPICGYYFILIDMFMGMVFVFLNIVIWIRLDRLIIKIILIIFLAFVTATARAMHVLLHLVIIF